MKEKQFWFIVGSQHLYGPEVLETVAARAAEMADWMNKSPLIPCTIAYKATVKTCEEITALMKEANYDDTSLYMFSQFHITAVA